MGLGTNQLLTPFYPCHRFFILTTLHLRFVPCFFGSLNQSDLTILDHDQHLAAEINSPYGYAMRWLGNLVQDAQ